MTKRQGRFTPFTQFILALLEMKIALPDRSLPSSFFLFVLDSCLDSTSGVACKVWYPLRRFTAHATATNPTQNVWFQIKRGQRGTLPVQALGYVKFGDIIFRRPFGAEVCFPDVPIRATTSIWCLKNHSKFCQ